MQKSKIFTTIFLNIFVIYTILSNTIFLNFYRTYTYIINPIFWILIAAIMRLTLGKIYENKKFVTQIIQYTLIAILTYIIVHLIFGLFVTFGKNPYKVSVLGILTNCWVFGTVIIAKEYIRYKIINNVYDKEKTLFAVLTSIIFSVFEFQLYRFLSGSMSFYYIVKQIVQVFLPIAFKNALYSYLALNNAFVPAILYEFFTKFFLWSSPILPKSPWIVVTIIDITIPVILLLYIRYMKNQKEIFRNKKKLMRSDPRNIIPLTIIIILAILFAIGIFPVKPISIATRKYETCS